MDANWRIVRKRENGTLGKPNDKLTVEYMRKCSGELSVRNICRWWSGICGEMSQEMTGMYPGNCTYLLIMDIWSTVDCPGNNVQGNYCLGGNVWGTYRRMSDPYEGLRLQFSPQRCWLVPPWLTHRQTHVETDTCTQLLTDYTSSSASRAKTLKHTHTRTHTHYIY